MANCIDEKKLNEFLDRKYMGMVKNARFRELLNMDCGVNDGTMGNGKL